MKNTIKYQGKLNAIGEKIKEYRKQNNLTQQKLVDTLQLYGIDLNKNSLQKIERGDRIIKEYELAVFCKVFDVSADVMLGGCIEKLVN